MQVDSASRIGLFAVGCHEQAEILHKAIRCGKDAIYAALRQTESPNLIELLQGALAEAGESTKPLLRTLQQATIELRNTAAQIADYDVPLTSYQLVWMEPKGRHTDALNAVLPEIPPPRSSGDELKVAVSAAGYESPAPINDDSLSRIAQAVGDESSLEVMRIAQSNQAGEERFKQILRVDPRFAGKNSNEWGSLLGVSPPAVRGYSAWKKLKLAEKLPD